MVNIAQVYATSIQIAVGTLKNAEQPAFKDGVSAFFKVPTAICMLVAYTCAIFTITGYLTWMPKYIKETFDLSTAQILKKKAFKEMANYFKGFDPKVLEAASPIKLINKKTKLAAQLYCGTADLTVEYSQSLDFADALQKKKGCVVDLQVYENYGHTPQGKKSDKMEEIFFKSVDFITKYL